MQKYHPESYRKPYPWPLSSSSQHIRWESSPTYRRINYNKNNTFDKQTKEGIRTRSCSVNIFKWWIIEIILPPMWGAQITTHHAKREGRVKWRALHGTVPQALVTHPLANKFNIIFVRADCASFERLKKLLNNAAIRESKKLPTNYTEHERHQQPKIHTPKGTFIQCSFHSQNGQRCSHKDEQCLDLRNCNSPAFDPAKKGTNNNRNVENINRPPNN